VAQAALITCISLIDTRQNSAEYFSAIRNAGLAVRRVGQLTLHQSPKAGAERRNPA
jgi:hypothetical protein